MHEPGIDPTDVIMIGALTFGVGLMLLGRYLMKRAAS